MLQLEGLSPPSGVAQKLQAQLAALQASGDLKISKSKSDLNALLPKVGPSVLRLAELGFISPEAAPPSCMR